MPLAFTGKSELLQYPDGTPVRRLCHRLDAGKAEVPETSRNHGGGGFARHPLAPIGPPDPVAEHSLPAAMAEVEFDAAEEGIVGATKHGSDQFLARRGLGSRLLDPGESAAGRIGMGNAAGEAGDLPVAGEAFDGGRVTALQ